MFQKFHRRGFPTVDAEGTVCLNLGSRNAVSQKRSSNLHSENCPILVLWTTSARTSRPPAITTSIVTTASIIICSYQHTVFAATPPTSAATSSKAFVDQTQAMQWYILAVWSEASAEIKRKATDYRNIRVPQTRLRNKGYCIVTLHMWVGCAFHFQYITWCLVRPLGPTLPGSFPKWGDPNIDPKIL